MQATTAMAVALSSEAVLPIARPQLSVPKRCIGSAAFGFSSLNAQPDNTALRHRVRLLVDYSSGRVTGFRCALNLGKGPDNPADGTMPPLTRRSQRHLPVVQKMNPRVR